MSTHIKILGQQDIQDFDAVPELSGEDRKKFFYIPMWAKEILENLRTPVKDTLKNLPAVYKNH